MDWQQLSIVIERGGRNYSAYSPELPGCVATGETLEEVLRNMAGAIEMHLEGQDTPPKEAHNAPQTE